MKKWFVAALLALPLLAVEARANLPCLFPFKIEIGPCCNFKISALNYCGCPCGGCSQCYGGGGTLGPWYNYWPMDAHFQTPALPEYPYYPAPMGIAGPIGAQPAQFHGGGFQPASFQAPSYWYGK
jgi:hypothetical protein